MRQLIVGMQMDIGQQGRNEGPWVTFSHLIMPSSSAIHMNTGTPLDYHLESDYSERISDHYSQSIANETLVQEHKNDTDDDKNSESDGMDEDAELNGELLGWVKPLLHYQHLQAERTILMNGKVQWMGCRGAAHKKVFLRIASQLHRLLVVKKLNELE